MHKKLEEIISKTKEDLIKRKQLVSQEDLKISTSSEVLRSFIQALKSSSKGVAIIAEVKLSSPNENYLGDEKDIEIRVKQYEEARADAISVVTEKHFFKGDPNFLKRIKDVTVLPILQKDFVIDEYQVYEAIKYQADAILLIARILSEEKLVYLVNLTQELGMEPIVEINSDEDFKKALKTKAKIIAVNARNLDTFEVDVDKACKLIKKIPESFMRLGFSGVKGKKDVEKYKNARVDGILIGTSLMKAKNISDFIKGVSL